MSPETDTATIAREVAQQIAEQVGQAVSQAIQKLLQTTGAATTGTGVFTREELGDIGGTENVEAELIKQNGLLFANSKRTYDEYQGASLETIRMNSRYVEKVLSDAHAMDMQARVIANRTLSNAAENDNLLAKQAIKHSDIATDRTWNVDEQGYTAASIISAMNAPAVKEAMAAAIASILAAMAQEKKTI